MSYNSPPVGNNLSWIFWGNPQDIYTNPRKLKSIIYRGLKEDHLTPLGWHLHKFADDAYSVLVPLSESHLSVHTYQEFDSLAFNLYSCLGTDSGLKTYKRTLEKIKPKRMVLIQHLMPVDIRFLGDLELKVEKH